MFDMASLGSTWLLWTILGFTVSRHNLGDLVRLMIFARDSAPRPDLPGIVGLRPP
jgi:hypothetical protein